jgi:phytoene/squalene synthetase
MNKTTANLARSITFSSSKQSFYTACLLVDKDLFYDCLRAYAYFRWADDVVDISCQSREECVAFIRRQMVLVNCLYDQKQPQNLSLEESMLSDLISHDRGKDSGLQSFIRNFMAVLEFDAGRRGRLISQGELEWYSNCLAKAVTDAIQYFIKNDHLYPESKDHYLAANGAHITHMLRDMIQDLDAGYINIPREYLEATGMTPKDTDSPPFRAWVQEQVNLAREYFRDGKRYLDEQEVLRCKIAGYWYCARFEGVLDTIESDGYKLRADYTDRRRISTGLKMGWLVISLTIKHVIRRVLCNPWRHSGSTGLKATVKSNHEI